MNINENKNGNLSNYWILSIQGQKKEYFVCSRCRSGTFLPHLLPSNPYDLGLLPSSPYVLGVGAALFFVILPSYPYVLGVGAALFFLIYYLLVLMSKLIVDLYARHHKGNIVSE